MVFSGFTYLRLEVPEVFMQMWLAVMGLRIMRDAGDVLF
jgi:hypothetical protein